LRDGIDAADRIGQPLFRQKLLSVMIKAKATPSVAVTPTRHHHLRERLRRIGTQEVQPIAGFFDVRDQDV